MYELAATISSIKAIGDIAAFFLNSTISVEVRQKAIELQTIIITLQNSIMSVQAQNQELTAENGQLKQQLASAEKWEEEATRYRLMEVLSGTFVYALHFNWSRKGEPIHWLCARCFQNKEKSILQKSGRQYACPICKNHITGPVDFPKIEPKA